MWHSTGSRHDNSAGLVVSIQILTEILRFDRLYVGSRTYVKQNNERGQATRKQNRATHPKSCSPRQFLDRRLSAGDRTQLLADSTRPPASRAKSPHVPSLSPACSAWRSERYLPGSRWLSGRPSRGTWSRTRSVHDWCTRSAEPPCLLFRFPIGSAFASPYPTRNTPTYHTLHTHTCV